ncbi:unnamed protein product [Calypogeia fissa]
MAGATAAHLVTRWPSTSCCSGVFPVENRRLHSTTLTSGFKTPLREPFPANHSHDSGNAISSIRCSLGLVGRENLSAGPTPMVHERTKPVADPKLHGTEVFRPRVSKPSSANEEKKKIGLPFYSTFANSLLDALENAVIRAFEGADNEKNYFLQGNYAPVEEFGPEPVLSVTGHVPECLNGAYLRVGPNPMFEPFAKYHWFDGDGMLHGLRIKDGKATYTCRYVRTARLEQEEFWGAPKFVKVGDLEGKRGLAHILLYGLRVIFGLVDVSSGQGTANTSLVYHDGKLLVLSEQDMPYVMRVLEDGDFETVSRLDYDKKLDHYFTAHPKIDPVTGEMFAFGYQVFRAPYATYRVISKDGVMGDAVPITVSGPAMMHDWAITENFAIFIDSPLHFSFKGMLDDQSVFTFDNTKPIRVGVLPRYAKDDSQMRWFECANGFLVHTANAWEEGDEVVLVACLGVKSYLQLFSKYEKEKCQATTKDLREYRFNLKNGQAQERLLGDLNTDFPTINADYVGRKNKFIFSCIFEDTTLITGIVKYDLTLEPKLGKSKPEIGGNIAGVFWHGSGRYGSEPLQVPKNPGKKGCEDDVYLLSFVHDENTGKSEVVVIDGKTMSSNPVVVIEMPSRVPYGFHSLFLTEEQLQLQKS